MSIHSYVSQEGKMRIAYIIDGSTELSPSNKKRDNIYSVPFKGYNESGTLVNITNRRHLDVLQDLSKKQYIEPTPGVYRDQYNRLLKEGYDYIVCIPQNQTLSSSFKFAEYASRLYKDTVLVVNADEYELNPKEILNNLLNLKEIKDDSNLIQHSIEQLLDLVKSILGSPKLIKT